MKRILHMGYVMKSIIKILLLLLIPVSYSLFTRDDSIKQIFKVDRKGIFLALALGFFCLQADHHTTILKEDFL